MSAGLQMIRYVLLIRISAEEEEENWDLPIAPHDSHPKPLYCCLNTRVERIADKIVKVSQLQSISLINQPVRVGISKTAGFGLFATKRIPNGTDLLGENRCRHRLTI